MLRLAIFTFCVNCAPTRMLPPLTPIPIAIVAPIPGAQKALCYVDTPPTAPELPDVAADIATEMTDKFFVHRRDYALVIQYNKDVATWMGQVRECLQKITDGIP